MTARNCRSCSCQRLNSSCSQSVLCRQMVVLPSCLLIHHDKQNKSMQHQHRRQHQHHRHWIFKASRQEMLKVDAWRWPVRPLKFISYEWPIRSFSSAHGLDGQRIMFETSLFIRWNIQSKQLTAPAHEKLHKRPVIRKSGSSFQWHEQQNTLEHSRAGGASYLDSHFTLDLFLFAISSVSYSHF